MQKYGDGKIHDIAEQYGTKGSDGKGFFRSPDMDKPASIPVTAGKNTAKTTQKDAFSGRASAITRLEGRLEFPEKIETRDITIKGMITNCALRASSAEIKARAAKQTRTATPTT